jgi:hypothetical protein
MSVVEKYGGITAKENCENFVLKLFEHAYNVSG